MKICMTPIKKLKSDKGETLVETLISMLIVVLSVTMLAGSIVTAARINQAAKDMNAPVQLDNVSDKAAVVKLTHVGAADSAIDVVAIDVVLYKTGGSVPYYYYEYNEKN
ncbi:MAG: hypothetical protein IJE67_07235 [Peptococcaceae bacterium]|nr:hypothetical protein [Peptococcaceae bacterium]